MDYNEGLLLLFYRFRDIGVQIDDALVESRVTESLSVDERRLNVEGSPYPISIDDPAALRLKLSAAQAKVARAPGARGGGNQTRRIRLSLRLPKPHAPAALAAWLARGATPPVAPGHHNGP